MMRVGERLRLGADQPPTDPRTRLPIGRVLHSGARSLNWLMNGVTALVAVALLSGVLFRVAVPGAHVSPFVTVPAAHGNLTVRVSATGTVEPVRIVDVSTELSGTFRQVHVQNNDRVTSGQLLAELDTETLVTQLIKSRAALQAARARLAEGRAGIGQADREFQRKQRLAEKRITTEREMDLATADVGRASAAADALLAEVAMAQADVDLAEANLKKARILSPIDGVVLRRNIEPGQAIAASLQSPVLFRIAADLNHMQVRLDVDEADALAVRTGQPAQFTVQALRDRIVEGTVEKVHFGPEIVQGVVTYKAIVKFDNAKLSLKPGMTVTSDIFVTQRRDALLVPNAAFRFSMPIRESAATPGLLSQLTGQAGAAPAAVTTPRGSDARSDSGNERRVWTVVDGKAVPVSVTIGATDGTMTEVLDGGLKPGDPVITDMADVAR